jgi:actin related protein 2/3 complex subunit 2
LLTAQTPTPLPAATIARTFLAQFVEARRAAALNTAPSCAYSPSTAPLELRGAPGPLADGANGGYVSLVIFKRHVAGGGKKLEAAVWSLNTFYAFVAFHIKCSKAYMHSSMRRRTTSLLQVLNRAKPDVEKEKKTASGRTFRAKPAAAPLR